MAGEPTEQEAAVLEAVNDVPKLKAMLKYVRLPGRSKVSWRRVLATRAAE